MLNKLKWKFARFMYGRYGTDELYMASAVLFIALQLLQIFIRNSFLSIITLLLVIWTFFRAFSKNILARQRENQIFLKFTGSVKSKWRMFIRRFQDIRSHRYRKCPECTTTLRLPRKRGTHKARCPKCSHLFDVKIWI
ncbi:hypothetical protein AAK882_03695 [Carnobacteriaceae bacterium 52-44]